VRVEARAAAQVCLGLRVCLHPILEALGFSVVLVDISLDIGLPPVYAAHIDGLDQFQQHSAHHDV